MVEAGRRFGVSQDDDRNGFKAGQDFFPALLDRMHLTAVLAKCGEFCARAEAFVKNHIALLCGLDQSALLDQDEVWPQGARQAVSRSKINLGLRAPRVQAEQSQDLDLEKRERSKERDDGWEL